MAETDGDVDEKSWWSFMDGAREATQELDTADGADEEARGTATGPPRSILNTPSQSSISSASSPSLRRPTSRSSNYKASLPTPLSGSSPATSSSTRRLPGITLDLSFVASPPTSPVHPSPSSSTVSLPSPSSPQEFKKKPFVVASLAIGLNEVVPHDDEDDDDSTRHGQPKSKSHSGASLKASKSVHLDGTPSPARSPSFPHGPQTKSGASNLSSSSTGSKLLPLSFGSGAGSGTKSLAAFNKFDAIVVDGKTPLSSGKSSNKDASHSPTCERIFASAESDFSMVASSKQYAINGSKLNPLDVEDVRSTSFASPSLSPSTSFAARPSPSSEWKSMAKTLTGIASSSSSSQEDPAAAPLSSNTSGSLASSPTERPVAQPKFRNPLKKNAVDLPPTAPLTAKQKAAMPSGDAASTTDDGIELVEDKMAVASSSHPFASESSLVSSSSSSNSLYEGKYLSFLPRSSNAKQSARDLPSLTSPTQARSDAKSFHTTSNNEFSSQHAPLGSPKQSKRHDVTTSASKLPLQESK